MKKYFSFLLLAIFGFVAISCNDDRDVDNDTYSVVYDVSENFTMANNYEVLKTFNNPLYNEDVILVYRRDNSGGTAVWQQIPRTLFLTEGELDYDFDFTANDVLLKAGGTINFANQPQAFHSTYLLNQVFRIVIVPASAGKVPVDYSNYNEVIKFFNIDDSKVRKL